MFTVFRNNSFQAVVSFCLFTKQFSVRMNKCDRCFRSRVAECKSSKGGIYLEQVFPVSTAWNPQYIIFIGQQFIQVSKWRMILVHSEECDDVTTKRIGPKILVDNNQTTGQILSKIEVIFAQPKF